MQIMFVILLLANSLQRLAKVDQFANGTVLGA